MRKLFKNAAIAHRSDYDEDNGNSIYYSLRESAIRSFFKRDLDASLSYAFLAGKCAWEQNLGFWYDDVLDCLLDKIGKEIVRVEETSSPKRRAGRLKVAYLVSSLSEYGGHSEVLRTWTQFLKEDHSQFVYLTNCHSYHIIPAFHPGLSGALEENNVQIKELQFYATFGQRVKDLCNLINDDSPDVLFLFIDPNDVVAVSAISALNYRPPVIYFNHADHVFWLGRRILDYLVDFRTFGAIFSREFRGIGNSNIVPLTTTMQVQEKKKRKRKELGIPDGATLSLSIASLYKVVGDPTLNYFNTIARLLHENPNHYHMFITSHQHGTFFKTNLPEEADIRNRFMISGPYSELHDFYAAADFLIDTFPYPGGQVCLEAMAYSLPIVAYCNRQCNLFSERDFWYEDYPMMASTEDEILEKSSELIADPETRREIGEKLNLRFQTRFSPEVVKELLRDIIEDDGSKKSKKIDGKHESEILIIDWDYLRCLGNNKFNLHAELLIQAAINNVHMRVVDRMVLYCQLLGDKEFRTIRRIVVFALVTFLGSRGIRIVNSIFSFALREKETS